MKTKFLPFVLFLLASSFAFAQPSNDDPCNAIDLLPTNTCNYATYTNSLATASAGIAAPSCGNYSGGDVWFSFEMPSNGYHVVVEIGPSVVLEVGMAIYSGSDCNNLTLIDCDDNGGLGVPRMIVDDGCNFINGGETFWVRIWENGNDNDGNFDICAYTITPEVMGATTSCNGYPVTGDDCCDAILLSGEQLDGYCGNSGGFSGTGNLGCYNIENDSWLAFVASESTVEIGIESSNCVRGKGLQVMIMETSDCTNFTTVSNCWNEGTDTTGVLTANGLIPGDTYYIMVDGWLKDTCDYALSVISGVESASVSVDDDAICIGETAQLSANVVGAGPFTYSWSPVGSLNDPTIANPIANPTSTTQYNVTITGTETYVDSVVVTVYPSVPDMPAITGPNSICQFTNGHVYEATSNYATNYNWTISGGGTIIGPTNQSTVTVNWGGSSGNLCLTTDNDCGVSPQLCYLVSAYVEPDITAVNPGQICSGESIDLDNVIVNDAANSNGTKTFYEEEAHAIAGFPFLTSTVVSDPGTYWIKVQTGTYCYDITAVTISVEDPQIVVNAPPISCTQATFDLSTVIINETGGISGTRTYYADSLAAVAATPELPSTTVSTNMDYWVRYETANGCFDVERIVINKPDQPDITVQQPASICMGCIDLDTVTLIDANNTTITTKYFYTSFGVATLGVGPPVAMTNTTVCASGTYYVRVATAQGCFEIESIDVSIGNPPDGSITGDATICPGETIDLNFSLSGLAPFDVVYNNGGGDINLNGINDGHIETLSVNSNTIYTLVSFTDANGCVGNVTGSPVDIVVRPEPTLTLSGTTTVCPGDFANINFALTGTAPFDVVYNDGNSDITLTGISNNHTEAILINSMTNFTPVSVSDAFCDGTVNGMANVSLHGVPTATITGSQSICNGDVSTLTFTMTGTGPFDIVYNDGSGNITLTGLGNIHTEDVLVSNNTSYSLVSVSDANCAGTVSGIADIIINTPPSATLSGDAVICENGTTDLLFNLTGTGPFDVVYNDGTNDFTLTGIADGHTETLTLTSSTAFNLVSVNDANCSGIVSGTATVTVIPAPEAILSGDAVLCNGDSLDLTINIPLGTAPFDVVYTDGVNNFTLDNIADGYQLNVKPTTNTTYSLVSIVDNTSNNCSGTVSGSAAITIAEAPVIGVTTYVCNNTNTQYQVQFTVVGGTPPYVFSDPNGIYDATTNTYTSDWINSGDSYSINVDDQTHCGVVDVTGLNVCDCDTNAGTMQPNVLNLCEDEMAISQHLADHTLDGDDALGFILHDFNGSSVGNVLMTNSVPEFSFANPLAYGTTYYISAVVANDDGTGFPVLDQSIDPCLSVAIGQPVVFTEIITASITGPNNICISDTMSLTFNLGGTALYDVAYSDGTDTTYLDGIIDGYSIDVSPNTDITYTLVSVSNDVAPFCLAQIDPANSSVAVTVTDRPFIQNVVVECNDDDTEFTVSFDIVGGDASSYTVNGMPYSGTTYVSSFMPSGTTYNFAVADANGCPPITITDTEYCNCFSNIRPVINVRDEISCFGESDGALTVTNLNGVEPVQFNWDTGAESTQIENLASSWYHVTMTDANDCITEDSLFLSDPPQIQATVTSTGVSCYGDQDGIIIFENITGGFGNYEYALDDQETRVDSIFYNLLPGSYTARIEDQNGCTFEDSIYVEEPEELIVSIGEDTTIQLGETYQLEALTSNPIDTFVWLVAPGMPCYDCLDPMVAPINETTYAIDVMDANGCEASDEVTVTVYKDKPIYIPTAFSPNGDGANDVFTIYAGMAVERVVAFRIFNRWGEQMFEAVDYNPHTSDVAWNGYFRNTKLNPNVYIYYAEVLFTDGSVEVITGDVTLLR